jgi:hypothetical protein
MVRLLLIVHVPHAGDERGVPLSLCPLDRFSLCFEGTEHVVCIVFDDIILNMTAFSPALRARLNINVCHVLLSHVALRLWTDAMRMDMA